MSHEVERVVEHTMRKWLTSEHVHERLGSGNVEENVGPYITISRETGAGGTEIARKVASKLGWDVLDKEILEHMAEKYNLQKGLLDAVDEKKGNWISEILTGWLEGSGYSQSSYVHRLGKMLMVAAHHGKFVVVGRGAQFVLPRDKGLSIRILAPLDFRVEQTVLKLGVSAAEAEKLVKTADENHEAFVKQYFHHKSADPHAYDLVINVEKLTQENAVNLIVDAANSWMKKQGVA